METLMCWAAYLGIKTYKKSSFKCHSHWRSCSYVGLQIESSSFDKNCGSKCPFLWCSHFYVGMLIWSSSLCKNCSFTCCWHVLHNLLAARTLTSGLKQVTYLLINAVNLVKFSALNSRIVHKLCSKIDFASTELLLHREVRWDIFKMCVTYMRNWKNWKGKMECKDLLSED